MSLHYQAMTVAGEHLVVYATPGTKHNLTVVEPCRSLEIAQREAERLNQAQAARDLQEATERGMTRFQIEEPNT